MRRPVTCSGCGTVQDDWTNHRGYLIDDERFCCEGCAEETGCNCGQPAETADEASREQIPAHGVEGKEEYLGQDPGGFMERQDHAHKTRHAPNDERTSPSAPIRTIRAPRTRSGWTQATRPPGPASPATSP